MILIRTKISLRISSIITKTRRKEHNWVLFLFRISDLPYEVADTGTIQKPFPRKPEGLLHFQSPIFGAEGAPASTPAPEFAT
jgi:hypothetical protein